MEALIMRASREVGLLLVVAAAALLVAVPVIVWRSRRSGLRRAAWTTVLEAAIIGSTVLIATLTLGAFGGGGRGQVNLVPFRSVFDNVPLGDFYVGLVLFDMLANVALYVPLGIAVGLRFPDLRFVWWVLAVGGSTVAIEAAQALILNRSADVTDALMNTLGGASGFVIARVVHRIARGAPADRQAANE